MKKTAIALAVAAIVSAPAMAEVKISGNAVYLLEAEDDGVDNSGKDGRFAMSDDDTDFDVTVTADLNDGWTGGMTVDLEGTGVDVNSVSLSHDAYGKITAGGETQDGTDGRVGVTYNGDIYMLQSGDAMSYNNTFGGVSAGISLSFAGDEDEAMAIGASGTFGGATVGFGYAADAAGEMTFDDDDADETTALETAYSGDISHMTVGGSYKISAITLAGTYEAINADTGAQENEMTVVSLKAGYDISEATNVYGEYSMISDTRGDADALESTEMVVGGSHKMGATTLAASYDIDASDDGVVGAEDNTTMTLSAKYDFGNGFYVKGAYELADDGEGDADSEVTTTSLSMGGKF